MLYIALGFMTIMVLLFALAWMRSPELRKYLEEPKYRFLTGSDTMEQEIAENVE